MYQHLQAKCLLFLLFDFSKPPGFGKVFPELNLLLVCRHVAVWHSTFTYGLNGTIWCQQHISLVPQGSPHSALKLALQPCLHFLTSLLGFEDGGDQIQRQPKGIRTLVQPSMQSQHLGGRGLHSKTLSQARSNRKRERKTGGGSQSITPVKTQCALHTPLPENYGQLHTLDFQPREEGTTTNLMFWLLTLQCLFKKNHGKKTVCNCDSNSKHTVCSVF